MKHFIASFLLLLSFPLAALAQVTTFQKSYGGPGAEQARSVLLMSDGGYMIAGYTTSFGSGNIDAYVIRTDSQGDTIWTRTYGGTQEDQAVSLTRITNNKFLVQGYTKSFGAGDHDLFLVCIDQWGDTIFSRAYGDSIIEYFYSGSGDVAPSPEGGYVLCGTAANLSANEFDLFIVKTDLYGNQVWSYRYATPASDRGNSIQPTADSCYIVTGLSGSVPFMMKIDNSGNVIWYNMITGQGEGITVRQTADGGYILLSEDRSSNQYGNFRLTKTNGTGNVQWTKLYGDPSNGNLPLGLDITSDGGYILSGAARDVSNPSDFDHLFIRTDGNGDTIWTRRYGDGLTQYSNGIRQAADGGYIATGLTGPATGLDFSLTKMDANGNAGCLTRAINVSVSTASLPETPYSVQMFAWGSQSNAPTTWHHGGTISTVCYTSSIDEKMNEGVKIYPNPSSDVLNIDIKDASAPMLLILYDVHGRVIKQVEIEAHHTSVSCAGVVPGIYFYTITSEGKAPLKGKLVIE